MKSINITGSMTGRYTSDKPSFKEVISRRDAGRALRTLVMRQRSCIALVRRKRGWRASEKAAAIEQYEQAIEALELAIFLVNQQPEKNP